MAPNTQTTANSTEDANTSGYATNQSQLRCSNQASSAVVEPGMVPTGSDSRARLTKLAGEVTAPSSESSRATGPKGMRQPKKKRVIEEDLSATDTRTVAIVKKKKNPKKVTKKVLAIQEVNSTGKAHDFSQDTNESIEIGPREAKKKLEKEYDDILDFFEPPFWKKEDKGNTQINYKCKWCGEIYCAHTTSRGNLKVHRDGSTQSEKKSHGCVNQEKAKKSGAKLPPSVAERNLAQANGGGDPKQTIISDLTSATMWSADESKKLYLMLKKTVFDELKNLNTKFTLIHDVWTTKGNRFAFIGASVAFINSNWDYTVRHLTLKMIPWKHFGHLLARPIASLLNKNNLVQKMLAQTTDSGSNNNTMADKMYNLFYSNEPPNADSWDPETMHIRCFCHKLALIVNAGLNSLSLKNLHPEKTKESVLGFFPILGRISKEDDEDFNGAVGLAVPPEPMAITTSLVDDYASESDYRNEDDQLSDTDTGNSQDALDGNQPTAAEGSEKHKKTSKIQVLMTKLDTVIKQITCSAAQRGSFNRMAKRLGIKVAPLIAGYGIHWNIKYKSHRKAIDAREVIDQLLKEDQQQNKAGIFNNVLFSPRDWKKIDDLNCELEVFVKLTSQMEGNQGTGAHVIPKYLELKEQLSGKLDRSKESDMLYPMYFSMLARVEKYLAEAMVCKTLKLATILHPCYWIHIFKLAFGSTSSKVKECVELLNCRFKEYKEKSGVSVSTLDAPKTDITVDNLEVLILITGHLNLESSSGS
ncbi:hypothetical protein PTTG_27687 [Puccinia triticina 1-1 BBBD Race 1]|uniref:BED-type domain-containing protein n=1 Tax=Puccinia triticina (isolate 1-1 / race 1 (BBBD)) TaxID=630390 RepID=A0A180GIA4_PUCT1|nr:hypothetical protein PTTG_27687 [Puccinia triticina 1-1 BBBD Race 1]